MSKFSSLSFRLNEQFSNLRYVVERHLKKKKNPPFVMVSVNTNLCVNELQGPVTTLACLNTQRMTISQLD